LLNLKSNFSLNNELNIGDVDQIEIMKEVLFYFENEESITNYKDLSDSPDETRLE